MKNTYLPEATNDTIVAWIGDFDIWMAMVCGIIVIVLLIFIIRKKKRGKNE